MLKIFKMKLLGLGLLIFVLGCNKENELKQDLKPLNSFYMSLNDQLWKPSLIDNNPCSSTFRCDYSEVDLIPFYTIKAYKDSQSRTNYLSENFLRVQIMNVNSTGVYNISDPYGDFNSYARFIINEMGVQKIYENSNTKVSSVVKIEEMIPIEGSYLTGISGSFSGILYNKVNPNDSIIIDNCKFSFRRLNRSDFSQCKD
jgi:hypothetical protein